MAWSTSEDARNYTTVTNVTGIQDLTTLTVMFWLYHDDTFTNFQNIIYKDAGYPSGWVVYRNAAELAMDVAYNPTYLRIREAGNRSTTGWNFHAFVANGGAGATAQKYFWGDLSTPATEPSSYDLQQDGSGSRNSDSGQDLQIGGRSAGAIGESGINADWAVFALCDVALTEAEVVEFQLTGRVPRGCQVYYHWYDNSNPTDLSGNGNDGTVTGGAADPKFVGWDISNGGVILPFTSAANAYTLTADKGTYTYSGVASNLIADYNLTAAQGSYTYSGVASNLEYGRLLAASQGSYTYSGVAATLKIDRSLTADQGSYTYSGVAANLNYSGAGYTLTADVGSYSYNGVASGLVVDRSLSAALGTYTLSGVATSLSYGRTLTADAGSYTLSGIDSAFSRTYALDAATGSYTYTGLDATLDYSGASATGINIDGAASQTISTNFGSLTLYQARGNYYTIN